MLSNNSLFPGEKAMGIKPVFKLVAFLLLIIITIVIGFSLLTRVTVNGIGLTPDSVVYISAAKSLLEGRGLFVGSEPMTHFPPVYSLLISFSGLFTDNLVSSTRILHTFFYCGNAILFGFCIFISTRRNFLAMVAGILLFFTLPAVLKVHADAVSESPFIFFSLLTFLLLYRYLVTDRKIYLWFSALIMGLAIATRYVGIALLPPLVIGIFLFNKSSIKTKLLTSLWSVAVAIVPITAWVIRNLILTSSAVNRTITFHPIDIKRIKSMIDTLHNFIFPSLENRWFNAIELVLVTMIFLYLAIVVIRKRSEYSIDNNQVWFFASMGSAFFISFILVLISSISFIDASTSMNERILLPAFLPLLISAFALVDLFAQLTKSRLVIPIFLVCMVFITRMKIPETIQTAKRMQNNGMGFNAVRWNESLTINEIKKLTSETKIYSNGFDAINIKTGRRSFSFPRKFNPVSTLMNKDYPVEMDAMCREVNNGTALIIYLDEVDWREYLPDEAEVIQACVPALIMDTSDGAIYAARK